ncbi:extracellular solute-binding protein [Vibrio sp. ED002]|uniref:sugar ABC transporter substrate-binding protein n=1 Tax=Vibrio sp. ED002 TaxID=2785123 RepID=UPI00200EDDA5|nr:extracellular solute-binding protein [Vibrio sp. ED002]UQA51536.1 extracellular solute-binding protein [Vibrio sp. ED002]
MRNLCLTLLLCFSNLTVAQEIQVWSGIEYSTVAEINERFEEQTGNTLAIREFDVNNIRSELLLAKQTGITIPDVIWVPSDFLGLHDYFDLAKIPSTWIEEKSIEPKALELVTVDNAIYGVPLGLGNHLVLYVNTKLTQELQPTWEKLLEEAKKGQSSLAMQYPNMYFLMSFVPMFSEHRSKPVTDIDVGALAAALRFYGELPQEGVVKDNYSQEQARQQFIEGEVAYLIDGDWSLGELKQHFSKELKISSLPTYNNHHMHSLSGGKVLAFNEEAMANPAKQKAMRTLAMIVQKPEFIEDVIINQNLISTNRSINRKWYDSDTTYYSDLYEELTPAYAMPSTVEMAVTWEALIRGYKRFKAGMPAESAAEFVVEFIQKHSEHIHKSRKSSS